MERGEREVLELVLDLLHAEAVGERCVDVEGLSCNALLLVFGQGGQGAHVVESVGQLDDEHPQVLGEGHEHLAHAGCLLFLAGVEVKTVQFGDAVDNERDVCPEDAFQVDQVDGRVLDGVVQQCCCDGHVV